MSSVSMASSLPRTEVLGFKDVSGQGQPLEIVSLPIFVAWTPLHTSWGPTDTATLVSGDGFRTIYGADNFNSESKFMSHQAAMVEKVLQTGALVLAQRLKAEGAKTATLRIWADHVVDKVEQYARNPDGTFKRTDGKPVVEGDSIDGSRVRFAVEEIDDTAKVREASPMAGTMTNWDGKPSTMYPIIDIEARFDGEKGGNFGIRLSAPTTASATPVNAELVEEKGAYVYRLALMSRPSVASTGSPLMNLDGSPSLDFTLKSGVVDPKSGINYGYDKRVLKSFENNDPELFSGYGPLKTFHVYDKHLQTLLEALYATEKDFGLIDAAVNPEHAINLFGGVNVNNVPYYTIKIEGPSADGVLFGETSSQWLVGGSDGKVTPADYDMAVQTELNVFGSGTVPLADRASFPMSTFVDTGFTLATKRLMANIMSVRPDAYIIASTQDVLEPLNTPEEDSSIGAMLRNTFALVPESEFYNTGACRALVMKHAGIYLDSTYDGILPFTIDFAVKLATYMGGDRMVAGSAPDGEKGRIVTRFVEHNAKFRPVKPRNTDWQAGISSAEPFDHRNQVFFPGIQTVYHDNTSVLKSFYPMAICCHLNRLGELAWRMFVGDSRKTAAEYVSDVDEFLDEQVKDKYDGRADITPRSYYTAADTQRSYSWHTDIEGLFDGIKTTEVLTVVAGRRPGTEATQ